MMINKNNIIEIYSFKCFGDAYRITAAVKVETDIIASLAVRASLTSCNTSNNVWRDLHN
jgi:hypothetical protein